MDTDTIVNEIETIEQEYQELSEKLARQKKPKEADLSLRQKLREQIDIGKQRLILLIQDKEAAVYQADKDALEAAYQEAHETYTKVLEIEDELEALRQKRKALIESHTDLLAKAKTTMRRCSTINSKHRENVDFREYHSALAKKYHVNKYL